MRRTVAVVALAIMALWTSLHNAEAQTAKTVVEDYDGAIKSAETIAVFGPDMFGESVNLKDGTASFSASDVGIKTNSGLLLAVGRIYGVNARDIDAYVDNRADGELFGNWKLDIPYMSGVFDERTGWVSSMSNPVQRCSVSGWSTAGPPSVPSAYTNWNVRYLPEEYWRGNSINIPGRGSESLLYLPSGSVNPADGRSYYWTTSGNWRVACVPSLKNGSGEGFLVVLPDGTRYTFDWMSSRRVAALKAGNCVSTELYERLFNERPSAPVTEEFGRPPLTWESGYNPRFTPEYEGGGGNIGGCAFTQQVVVNRREYFLYATRVEDRHGNWVEYTYDPDNPRRLTRVISNDGAAIDLSYGQHGKVATVSANGRVWQYQYADDSGAVLSTVVRPDGTRWTYQYGDLYSLLHSASNKVLWADCVPSAPGTATASVTIGHPTGAQGVFTFRNMLHGTDRTPGGCETPNPDRPLQVDLSARPMVYKAASLVSKQLSGPGLTTQTWNYAYQPSWSWNDSGYYDDPNDPASTTTTTEVTEPDGTINRMIFGNDFYRSAGQLKKVETISGGVVVAFTEYEYVSSAAGQRYPSRVGWDPNATSNPFETEQLHPLSRTSVYRDGDRFDWKVDTCDNGASLCFDNYARPTAIVRQNSLGAYKKEVIDYHDNLALWVLGQVRRNYVTNTDINNAGGAGSIVVSEVEYDQLARPWKTYAFGKLQQTLGYGADGAVAYVADGKGQATKFSNYFRGIPRSVVYPPTPESPTGATKSSTVDGNGWITSTVDEDGAKTCYDYDSMGRLSSVIYPSEVTPGVCDTSKWEARSMEFRQLGQDEWVPAGMPKALMRSVVVEGNHALVTYMDAMQRPLLSHEYDTTNVAATLRSTRSAYDAAGRTAFISYPSSDLVPGTSGKRLFYDALGRVVRTETDSERDVLTTKIEYLNGLRVRTTNPRGMQSVSAHLAWDKPNYELPVSSVQPEGKVVEIVRHPQFGWPLKLVQRSADQGHRSEHMFVYSGKAELCKTLIPETGATVVGYDAAGNLTWSVTGLSAETFGSQSDCQHMNAIASGPLIRREYDARNRLGRLYFPDGRGDQVWTYTKTGLPSVVTAYNDSGSTSPVTKAYSYNARRMLVAESIGQSSWYTWGIGYGYDRIGNLRSQTYPTGLTIDYAPNALGQATSVRDQANSTYASAISYYPNGALKQFTYGNGIIHTVLQNARQLPARVTSAGVADYAYRYDQNGNVESIWDHARDSGDGFYGRWMTYDGLDRLTAVGSCAFGGDCWHRMSYDALDNLRSWKLGGVKDYAEYVYNDRNQLTNIRNGSGASVVGLGYDDQGNLANKNGQAFQFDQGNRLRVVAGKEVYRYDADGRRVFTRDPISQDSMLFYYSKMGRLTYQEVHRAAKLVSEFIYLAGGLIATREQQMGASTHSVKYSHADAAGSPVAVTNANGQLVERMDYEPWGSVIGKPQFGGIGYTGHVMDAATGLTYMQQRYYDQSLGRFLSVDPVHASAVTGTNFNRYAYANNNTYRFTDPDGRQSGPAIGSSVGAGCGNYAVVCRKGKDFGFDDESDSGSDNDGFDHGSSHSEINGNNELTGYSTINPPQSDGNIAEIVVTTLSEPRKLKGLDGAPRGSIRNPARGGASDIQAEYYRKEAQRRTLNAFTMPAKIAARAGIHPWSLSVGGLLEDGTGYVDAWLEYSDNFRRIEIPTDAEILEMEAKRSPLKDWYNVAKGAISVGNTVDRSTKP